MLWDLSLRIRTCRETSRSIERNDRRLLLWRASWISETGDGDGGWMGWYWIVVAANTAP